MIQASLRTSIQVGAALNDLDPGDQGAAILWTGSVFPVVFSATSPRISPRQYTHLRRLIDRGSQAKIDDALAPISDTNTTVYSVGFRAAKPKRPATRTGSLPIHSGPTVGLLVNAHPGPPHGCMGKDPDPDAARTRRFRLSTAWVSLLLRWRWLRWPPSRRRRLKRNVPETVAHLTGRRDFKLTDAAAWEVLLTISNHVPNRYVLSFRPMSPHPGFHALEIELKEPSRLR